MDDDHPRRGSVPPRAPKTKARWRPDPATVVRIGISLAIIACAAILLRHQLTRAVTLQTVPRAGFAGRAAQHPSLTPLAFDALVDVIVGIVGVGLIRATTDRNTRRPLLKAAMWLFPLGAALGLAQNVAARFAYVAPKSAAATGLVEASRLIGALQWGAWVIAAVIYARARTWPAPVERLPEGFIDVPPSGRGTDRSGLGICCSGGGSRSAAFGLGALQALDHLGQFERADYISAVSGGGYTAAAFVQARRAQHSWMALYEKRTGKPFDHKQPPSFAPGSDEARWIEKHCSFLFPDGATSALTPVLRVVAGIVVNLFVVWVTLFVFTRPVGWLIREFHPELAASAPRGVVRDRTIPMNLSVREHEGDASSCCGTPTLFDIDVAPVPLDKGDERARVDVAPVDDGIERDERYSAEQRTAGRASVLDGVLTVEAQPTVAVTGPFDTAGNPIAAGRPADRGTLVEVDPGRPLTVSAKGGRVAPSASDVQAHLELKGPVTVRSTMGLYGRRHRLTIDPWMWWSSIVAGLIAGVIALLTIFSRSASTVAGSVSRVAGALALAWFTVVVALPWLAVAGLDALQSALDSIPIGDRFVDLNNVLPALGVIGTILTGLSRLFANRSPAPTSSPRRRRRQTRLANEPAPRLDEPTIPRWIAGILILLGFVVVVLKQVNLGIAAGAGGRFAGFAQLHRHVTEWWWWPDWSRWALAIVVLVALDATVDATSWSLHEWYKRRLSDSLLLKRSESGEVVPVDYADELRLDALANDDLLPELVLCCAVNTSSPDGAPVGLRSSSFVFTPRHLGGPDVGYVPWTTYHDAMSPARQRDISLPSAMAISGAAFAPAMGKVKMGALRTVLTLANVRLGLWIPQPRAIERYSSRNLWWHRPGASWYLRELVGRFRSEAPYVYVSDGGHWENLGLVELLRRGCTKIVCIDGGGAGGSNGVFEDLGDALTLAMQQLDLTITVEPDGLRARLPSEDDPLQVPMSSTDHIVATAWSADGRPVATIVYLRPVLTSSAPFNAIAYAEAAPVFPNDRLANQTYDFKRFDTYRSLGFAQATNAWATLSRTGIS